ncbi:MAG: hypothetical protein JOZ57_06570 [Abitibacteriaceae bacterium]|nr:hypothetical protein [Abditibacteriaceae bacterium]
MKRHRNNSQQLALWNKDEFRAIRRGTVTDHTRDDKATGYDSSYGRSGDPVEMTKANPEPNALEADEADQ